MECFKPSGVINALAQLALKLRDPAQRYFGSVSAAVAVNCILYGGYLLSIGTVYCDRLHWYEPIITVVGAGVCFILVVPNVAVLTLIFMKNYVLMNQVLCINLAMNMMTSSFSIVMIVWTSIASRRVEVPLCESGHFVLSWLYMGFLYCLMTELKYDEETDSMENRDGWLKNNLVQQPFSLTRDDQCSKAKPDTPAVFTPSSCPNNYIAEPIPTHILSISDRDNNTGPVS